MTEPLTVDELERQARELIFLLCPEFRGIVQACEERGIKNEPFEYNLLLAKNWLESHSRQLWLEAAQLREAALRLLHARSHTMKCAFTGCTCGAAADFRDALANLSRELQVGGRYLRNLQPKETESNGKRAESTPKPSPALPREEK